MTDNDLHAARVQLTEAIDQTIAAIEADPAFAAKPKNESPAHERGIEYPFHGLLPGRHVTVVYRMFSNVLNLHTLEERPAIVVRTFGDGVIHANVMFDDVVDRGTPITVTTTTHRPP